MRRAAYLALWSVIGVLYLLAIGVAFGFSIYRALKSARGRKALIPMVCTIDTDCPSGLICVHGRCVAA